MNYCVGCEATFDRSARNRWRQPSCPRCGSSAIMAAKPVPFVVYDPPDESPPQWRQLRLRNSTEHRILQLAARDGWACHLCGAPIDPAVRPYSAMGATIDHVVPLSAGGSRRSKSNMRLAHRRCNNERGNRPLAASRESDP